MSAKKANTQDPGIRPAKTRTAPLRLRGIAGRFTWDADTIWAWYKLSPRRWSFLTDGERAAILHEQATGYGELLGRQMRLRVTHRPFPAHDWARQLDANSPNRVNLAAFTQLLTESQRAMRGLATAEAEHFLGIEVGPRSLLDRGLAGALPAAAHDWIGDHGLGDRMLRRATADIQHVDRVVVNQLAGRPATPGALDFLLNRSYALGIPHSDRLTPRDGIWEAEDLFTYTDGVTVTEHPWEPYLTVTDRRGEHEVTRLVTVLTLGRVDELELAPRDLPLLAIPLATGFPVEIVASGKLLTGQQVERGMRRQITRITGQIGDYESAHVAAPPGLERRAQHAIAVGDELQEPVAAVSGRWRGWVRFAVAGKTPEEVAYRAGELKKAYARRHITLHREPQSRELLGEFMPHERVGSGAYVRQMPVRMFAATLPQVTAQVGDRVGPLIGHTVSGPRRPVMMEPTFGPEQLDGPGLCPVIAGLGGGKSFLFGLLAEQNVWRGIQTTVLDPSAGAFVRLASAAGIRPHARVIDLAAGGPGTLSPWSVVADPNPLHYDTREDFEHARRTAEQERMVLAEDICRALLPVDLAGRQDLRLALTEAISEVGGAADENLMHVLEQLASKGDVGASASRFLRQMADYPRANLFFGAGTERAVVDETLVVITFSGLVLPQPGIDRTQWTTDEQIAVPLLNLATALTFRRVVHKPRHERHVALFDELGILQGFPSFRGLFTRFSRDSRKLNTLVGFADQTPRGVLEMGLLPFVGSAFVGVTDDDEAAMESQRVLGLRPDPRYAQVLRSLPRPRPDQPLPYRDFVYRDPAGQVERIRVTTDHRPGLRELLNTTPRQMPPPGREGAA